MDVGVRETCFFGAYLQDMKKGGDGDCTFARLDIVKGVLADVVLSRQHIVGLGTVLRQRLNLSTEPLEGGVGVKSCKGVTGDRFMSPHHRLVVYGQQLFVNTLCNRIKPHAGTSGEYYSSHAIFFILLVSISSESRKRQDNSQFSN